METTRVAKDEVLIRLTYDEALVLSDLLDRWQRSGFKRTAHAGDPAGFQVLDDLCASFEPIIGEAFSDNYGLRRLADVSRLFELDGASLWSGRGWA